MSDRLKILVLGTTLALSLMVTPAHAWPGDRLDSQAAGWWTAVLDFLEPLLGLDTPDGSVCIDAWGNPACPPPPATPQGDNSVCIDPNGSPACQPRS